MRMNRDVLSLKYFAGLNSVEVFLINLNSAAPLSSVIKGEVVGGLFVSSKLYSLGDDFYLYLSNSNYIKRSIGTEEPVVVGVLWAPSHAAALRAVADNLEGDDFSKGLVPECFLLLNGCSGYGDFLCELRRVDENVVEAASYRLRDGLFVFRYINGGGFKLFFRGCDDNDKEYPFAVLRLLKLRN